MKIFNANVYIKTPSEQFLQKMATALCFFCLGFSTAAWAPLIPLAQQRLGLDHSSFGVLLLAAGVGSMLAMPIAGKLTQKVGCRPILAVVLLAFIVILPALVLSSTMLSMAISLFFFGVSAGALGVTINIQATEVERLSDQNLMSAFHGICSLGGLGGVVLMTGLLSVGFEAIQASLMVGVIIFLILVTATPFNRVKTDEMVVTSAEEQMTNKESDADQKARPTLAILAIGFICFIAFLSEGAAMDWSGIYLTEDFNLTAAAAGLAYSCFAAMMVIGRFSGHWVIGKFGENNTIILSAVLAAIGLGSVILAPVWQVVLIGYALVGLGSANIVPLMFSRAGRQKQMPSHIALSYVSVFAYTGSLVGPALVGFGSHFFGLSFVFAFIALALASIVVLNHFTKHTKPTIVLGHFDSKTPA